MLLIEMIKSIAANKAYERRKREKREREKLMRQANLNRVFEDVVERVGDVKWTICFANA